MPKNSCLARPVLRSVHEKPSRCLCCKAVSVRLRKGVGRTTPYRVFPALPIPDHIELPTCGHCGAEYASESTDTALDRVLAAVYLDALQELAKESIRTLTTRNAATKHRAISMRKLELLLGLSQGYLSRLLAGDGRPSAQLVLLLGLLSLSPPKMLQEVRWFWTNGNPSHLTEKCL